jgi:branched-subunit amino acid aminotransferase/4-amino-4-deoxychorismate lyase
MAEVLSIVRIDGRPIGNGRPGPMAAALRQKFRAFAGADTR